MKKMKKIITLIATSILLISCSQSIRPFFVKSLRNIELGSTQEEVKNFLGEPHDISDSSGKKWYYFDNAFKSKFDTITNLLENVETEADSEKVDRLYSELEGMNYKCTMIKFDSNDKVIEVFYDTNHKFEEFNDYATTDKSVSSVDLSVPYIQYYTDSIFSENNKKIIDQSDSFSYSATFSDGSYINSYVNNSKIKLLDNYAVVTWKDKIADYQIRKNLNKIGYYDVWGNFKINPDLTSIVIPSSVTSIDSYAFKGCNKLTTVTIPKSVLSINDGAFEDCKSLRNVKIEDNSSLIFIGKNVFKNTIVNFITKDNCKYLPCGNNDTFALIHVGSAKDNLEIKSDTRVIAADALNEYNGGNISFESDIIECKKEQDGFVLTKCIYKNVTYFSIPSFVTRIDSEAFSGCNSLVSVFIPNSVTSIGNHAFKNCTSLRSVTFEEECKLTSLEEGLFLGCSSLTSLIIPNSVRNIGFAVLKGCKSIESLSIPFAGESSIGLIFGSSSNNDNSKYIPNSLKKVIITGGTSIGANAFYDCRSLTSVVIPNSVTSIGASAFDSCGSLTSITISNSVTSIGDCAFRNCTSLLSVKFEEECKLTILEEGLFSNCRSLTSITIPNSVTSIGFCAFENCTSLESITIPFVGGLLNGTSNTHFGYIFGAREASNYDYGNSRYVPSSLKEVIITGGTSIGDSAFRECSSLTSVVIPNSVTSIGDGAFRDCRSLTSIVIPNSVTRIGEFAFYNCSSLTSITIPNSVTSIGGSAFLNCDSYNVYGNCLYLGNEENPYLVLVKAMNTSISGVSISNETRIIMDNAFIDCNNLTTITIPNSVTTIGNSAFADCYHLTSVVIPDSVTSIGDYAFVGYSPLTIYCEASAQPSGWSSEWNFSNKTVYWKGQWSYVNGIPTPNK